MQLLITHQDLARLVSDLQSATAFGLGSCRLRMRWVNSNESGEWFSVELSGSQVKALYAIIPRETITERYHSRT